LRQHLTAVRAAAAVGGAEVEGDALGAPRLRFAPAGVTPGSYRFTVGSAGSALLVLQTVLPPLLTASGPSEVVVEGGTHNPSAPPFEFVARAYLPLVRRMGPTVTATLDRHGFYPAGGGRVTIAVGPAPALRPLELAERGAAGAPRVRAVVADLPETIARTEARAVTRAMGWPDDVAETAGVPSDGPGNALLVELASAHVTEVFSAFGERGCPAPRVADDVVGQVRRYLAAGVPVGPHLADQLVLLLALAGGGRFRTVRPTRHLRTNVAVIGRFLDVPISLTERGRDDVAIVVGG
jgi:RNA 3'-terminal phosphate cyclase (ATP)